MKQNRKSRADNGMCKNAIYGKGDISNFSKKEIIQ